LGGEGTRSNRESQASKKEEGCIQSGTNWAKVQVNLQVPSVEKESPTERGNRQVLHRTHLLANGGSIKKKGRPKKKEGCKKFLGEKAYWGEGEKNEKDGQKLGEDEKD